MDLQRFATAGPSAGSGKARRRRNQGHNRAAAAVVRPLRRTPRARRPARAAPAKAAGVATAPAPAAIIPASTVKYVVQPGDTLHRIALRFSTTARLLAVLNELHKPVLLVPGEVILVPEHHVAEE